MNRAIEKVMRAFLGLLFLALAFLSTNQTCFASDGPEGGAAAPTFVIGHTSPDADSIVGAIAAASFYGFTPARSGAINPETRYILKRFGAAPPVLLQDVDDKRFLLIDFNVRSQALDCLKPENIVGVIDHHPIQDGSFLYNRAISIRTEPWGSVVSIVADLYFKNDREIEPRMAGLMLGAILSDTSGLDESKATSADVEIAGRLREILDYSESEVHELWEEMIAAKSDLASLDMIDIVQLDYKRYAVNGYLIGIGVAETSRPGELLARRDEILESLEAVKDAQALDYIVFSVTDVRDGSESLNVFTLPDSPEAKLALRAYGSANAEGIIRVAGQTSRKRFLKPRISEIIATHDGGDYVPRSCD